GPRRRPGLRGPGRAACGGDRGLLGPGNLTRPIGAAGQGPGAHPRRRCVDFGKTMARFLADRCHTPLRAYFPSNLGGTPLPAAHDDLADRLAVRPGGPPPRIRPGPQIPIGSPRQDPSPRPVLPRAPRAAIIPVTWLGRPPKPIAFDGLTCRSR